MAQKQALHKNIPTVPDFLDGPGADFGSLARKELERVAKFKRGTGFFTGGDLLFDPLTARRRGNLRRGDLLNLSRRRSLLGLDDSDFLGSGV